MILFLIRNGDLNGLNSSREYYKAGFGAMQQCDVPNPAL